MRSFPPSLSGSNPPFQVIDTGTLSLSNIITLPPSLSISDPPFQVIDTGTLSLSNIITFPPEGSFTVQASISLEASERVTFK